LNLKERELYEACEYQRNSIIFTLGQICYYKSSEIKEEVKKSSCSKQREDKRGAQKF
jgi:hypothetical protein